tara:strand:+ start:56 stop:271 length:216 start_codon:yes stop_codon:yes gene_type:complete
MNQNKTVFLMKFRNFIEAREFARTLKLKNRKEWDLWCSRNKQNKPKDIPALPNVAYKEQGWVNYDDWLGIK